MKSQKIVKNQGGVVLLEGLIAVTIFAFGVLAIIGMQASTTRATSDAKYRVDASFVLNQALGIMWSDRSNLGKYAVVDEAVATLPNGKRTITVGGVDNKDVTVKVTWQLPGESTVHTHSSITRIDG